MRPARAILLAVLLAALIAATLMMAIVNDAQRFLLC